MPPSKTHKEEEKQQPKVPISTGNGKKIEIIKGKDNTKEFIIKDLRQELNQSATTKTESQAPAHIVKNPEHPKRPTQSLDIAAGFLDDDIDLEDMGEGSTTHLNANPNPFTNAIPSTSTSSEYVEYKMLGAKNPSEEVIKIEIRKR